MSSSAKILIVISLVSLVVLGGVAMFFMEIRSVNEQANAYAEQVRAEQQRQYRSESLQEMLENNAHEIARLDEYVVGEEGTPALLSRVEEIGAMSGASVNTRAVEATPGDLGQGEEILGMNITIAGTWQEVYRTIALIETTPLKITVTAFNLSSNNSDEEEIRWEATVKLNVVKLISTP